LLTGPGTSRLLVPFLMDNQIIQPWMQLIAPGSVKSSIVARLRSDATAVNLLAGTIIVRPLS
jgi:hypothetical protein